MRAMSTSFCFTADDRAPSQVSPAVCAGWYAAMVPLPPAPPGWLQVPAALLPAGIVAAWLLSPEYGLGISFCFTPDARAPSQVMPAVCAGWYAAMVPVPPAPPGWLCVPEALLPAGIVSAWFLASEYVAPPPPPARFLPTYSYMRRMLRAHRVELRIASSLLDDHGLDDEFQERVEDETGNSPHWLGISPYMDEPDSAPDPQVALELENGALRAELADRRAFIAAARRLAR